MSSKIDEHGRLEMTVTPEQQAWLRAQHDEDPDAFDRDDFMYDMLESMTTNDEFQWICPSWPGDLTTAPMLAILGSDEPGPDDNDDARGSGLVPCGRWEVDGVLRQMYQPILFRWAFMAYETTSVQRALMEDGRAVWDGGAVLVRDELATA